ncbi:uncharacterized protein EDB93DRAFT_490568 [Suillus bovinus]|uniref:uncharacterized protein n=1 Tax=Suillus bovinus TaxID=48563 RepID=UPI001B880B8B|nr:uncharacterized protein EDB93DRAFT_490568 [Suillus bovinus]KAG2146177.1 hypothetical protein EDB93DRAFT_490568 [Suillus bovinus]
MFQHIKASRISTLPFIDLIPYHALTQKMHFFFVLAVVTALTATVSANDADCHSHCDDSHPCCPSQNCFTQYDTKHLTVTRVCM